MFIHYGSKKFDRERFEKVKNADYGWVKPDCGGLWGSPVGSECGWKQWNETSHFTECDESNAFRFDLTPDARILHLYSADDLKDLPKIEPEIKMQAVFLDFEAIVKEYDAIWLHLSEDRTPDWERGLYWLLYGWDCDCILVLNSDVVRI
jgi:hypothetical protein